MKGRVFAWSVFAVALLVGCGSRSMEGDRLNSDSRPAKNVVQQSLQFQSGKMQDQHFSLQVVPPLAARGKGSVSGSLGVTMEQGKAVRETKDAVKPRENVPDNPEETAFADDGGQTGKSVQTANGSQAEGDRQLGEESQAEGDRQLGEESQAEGDRQLGEESQAEGDRQLGEESQTAVEGRELEAIGLSVKVQEASPFGVTLLFRQQGKAPTGALQYGQDFRIEKREGGKWKSVPVTLKGDYGFCDLAYLIRKQDTTKCRVDWEWLYGKLPSGEYRIAKSVLDYRKVGDYTEYVAYGYFTLA